MRLIGGSFQRATSQAGSAIEQAAQALGEARITGASKEARCQNDNLGVISVLAEEAQRGLDALNRTMEGGADAWKSVLNGALAEVAEAGTAFAVRTAREALSASAIYAAEFVHRKAYAAASVVDMVMNIGGIVELGLAAEADGRARAHLRAFEAAIQEIARNLTAIQYGLDLLDPNDPNAPYRDEDFTEVIYQIALSESFLHATPPMPSQARARLDTAAWLLATGQHRERPPAAEVDALFEALLEGTQNSSFFDVSSDAFFEHVGQALNSRIIGPAERAIEAAMRLPRLIEKAADEYAQARWWANAKMTIRAVLSHTRRGLLGPRLRFVVERAQRRLGRVRMELEEVQKRLPEVESSELVRVRAQKSVELMAIRSELQALAGENAALIEYLNTLEDEETGTPSLFGEQGYGRVEELEIVLRLIVAALGRQTGQQHRITEAQNLLSVTRVMVEEAYEWLDPALPLPPGWATVRMLMREAGVERPAEALLSGGFMKQAVEGYQILSQAQEAMAILGQDSPVIGEIPKPPCAPVPVARASESLAENAVVMQMNREREDQLAATTALDAIETSVTHAKTRTFSLQRLIELTK